MQTARANAVYGKVEAVLHMAMELSAQKWLVAFSDGGRRRQVTVPAGERERLLAEIERAKTKLGLPPQARVVSCYEAGRDGHWLHRWLRSEGIDNREVDASSIAVPRRGKRVKTDRVDVLALLSLLERVLRGEHRVWSEVHVPSPEAEDAQRSHRERGRLLKERTAHRNRIQSLLVTQGLRLDRLGSDFETYLEQVQLYDDRGLGAGLKAELRREWFRYQQVSAQLRELEQAQRAWLQQGTESRDAELMRHLWQLRGLGEHSVGPLVGELFGWRRFQNRRQLAGLVGLVPVPYRSGSLDHEQGISKAGSARLRALLIELAWSWLRFQPQSALSQWFARRFGSNGRRSRRVGIVAVARKLLIALWRYLEDGVVPEGAVLKA